jgi:hypothetical protein
MKRTRNSDAVGMRDIDNFIRRMKSVGVRVILAGVRTDLLEGLRAAGALDHLDPDQVFTEGPRRGSSAMQAIGAALKYLEANKSEAHDSADH